MIRNILKAALISTALVGTAGSALAQETVTWWDFLGGGDGVRMKKLIEDFNAEHAGKIEIQATTLEWGVPFYTKLQTSTAVGEGPDVATYHLSRLPAAVANNVLAPISAEDLASVGLSSADYPAQSWEAAQADGVTYAVPFDLHPVVLYYNKDILEKAGLIGADGLPTGLNGLDNFTAALQKVKDAGATWGIANPTADGNFLSRTIFSFLGQQDGQLFVDGQFLPGDNLDKLTKALSVVAGWTASGAQPANTDYPAAVALFTSGEAAFMINGVWEVPTMTDLNAQGKLFNWGAIELPVLFDHPSSYADSHSFVIPANAGKEMTAEKKAAVLEVISWMNKHSLLWATAGHIPAYKPVTDSAEYKAMQPNATYSVLTSNVWYDPKSIYTGAASPSWEVAGNYFTPAINGELDPAEAATSYRDDLQALVE